MPASAAAAAAHHHHAELALINTTHLGDLVHAYRTSPPMRIAYTAYSLLFLWPLQQLYARGVWRSRPLEDICAELTSAPSDFWAAHPAECAELVYNHFDSWVVWLQFALYATTLGCCCAGWCRALWRRFCT